MTPVEFMAKRKYAEMLRCYEHMRSNMLKLVIGYPRHESITEMAEACRDTEDRLLDAYYKLGKRYGFNGIKSPATWRQS